MPIGVVPQTFIRACTSFGVSLSTARRAPLTSHLFASLILILPEASYGFVNECDCRQLVDVSILSALGTCADPGDCPADLNRDGAVDGADSAHHIVKLRITPARVHLTENQSVKRRSAAVPESARPLPSVLLRIEKEQEAAT